MFFLFFIFASRSALDGCFLKNGPQTNKRREKTNMGKGQDEGGKENRKRKEGSISSLQTNVFTVSLLTQSPCWDRQQKSMGLTVNSKPTNCWKRSSREHDPQLPRSWTCTTGGFSHPPFPWNVCSAHYSHSGNSFKDTALRELSLLRPSGWYTRQNTVKAST